MFPRSHPDGYSVNARCLDMGTIEGMTIEPFDGRDWEKQVREGRAGYPTNKDLVAVQEEKNAGEQGCQSRMESDGLSGH
jgi:hypothetical protein